MKAVIRQITQKKTNFEINWNYLEKHTKKQLQKICENLKIKYDEQNNKELLIKKINQKVK